MGHFRYEIDERRLRIRLRSLEEPVNDHAWSEFESKLPANPVSTASLPKLRIPMNHRLVLPATLGVIVLALSLLLSNFATRKEKPAAQPETAYQQPDANIEAVVQEAIVAPKDTTTQAPPATSLTPLFTPSVNSTPASANRPSTPVVRSAAPVDTASLRISRQRQAEIEPEPAPDLNALQEQTDRGADFTTQPDQN